MIDFGNVRVQMSDMEMIDTHLTETVLDLSLEGVALLLDLLEAGVGVGEALLGVPETVDEFVALVQHGHHQLLQVRVVGRQLAGALADGVLGDGGHHVTHHVPHVRLYRPGLVRLYHPGDASHFG